MKKRLIHPVVLLALVLFNFSCKDQYTICDLSKDVFFRAGFYKIVAGNEVLNNAPKFSLAPLNGNFIYTDQLNTTAFPLSLNPLLDSNRYYIKFSDALPADTLTIVYSSTSTQLSVECGSVTVNTISRIYSTRNSIDSLQLKFSEVNTSNFEHVKIYF